ncbi:hypothetical protein K474DRAFT_1773092 [Panus rudis PR-1116 ss-1]|nr:hypothetical protein K474DRAFT_1773092 [Panus rudis PR-1116 ss-1]
MTSELQGRIVGYMPISMFLSNFVHANKAVPKLQRMSKNTFHSVWRKGTNEDTMVEKLIYAVENNEFCPNFELKCLPPKRDGTGQQTRPKLCLYSRPQCSEENWDWASLEFSVDVHANDHDDPFSNVNTTPYDLRSRTDCDTNAILQSIERYLTAQLSRQHRTFTFLIYIYGRYVRFIRADRSAIIVSAPLNYLENPRPLAEFFWRYNYLSPEDRGFDQCVRVATELERALLTQAVSGYQCMADTGELRRLPKMDRTLEDDYPTYQIRVHDELGVESATCLIRTPFFIQSLFKRATRGYVALRIDGLENNMYNSDNSGCLQPSREGLARRLVFLKDSWRLDFDEAETEAEIYTELRTCDISHIPHVPLAGDVSAAEDPEELQTTKSQEWANAKGARWKRPCKRVFYTYVHHRVIQELAFPLSTLHNAKELVQVFRDAMQCMVEAYVKCDRLHCDISYNNVMVAAHKDEDGNTRGILNDWDISRTLSEDQCVESCGRIGTWRFMSIKVLQDDQKPHEIHDDLESLFWVLVYTAIRHFKLSWAGHRKATKDMFDDSTKDPNTSAIIGGALKSQFLSRSWARSDFTFDCPALQSLILELRQLWAAYHDCAPEEMQLESSQNIHNTLRWEPAVILKHFDDALDKDNSQWVNGEKREAAQGQPQALDDAPAKLCIPSLLYPSSHELAQAAQKARGTSAQATPAMTLAVGGDTFIIPHGKKRPREEHNDEIENHRPTVRTKVEHQDSVPPIVVVRT